MLAEDDAGEDEPCPALDPAAGTCDLYAARPITCRTFGPPVRFDGESLAVCELCFDGASDDEIAACEVEIDSGNLESALLGRMRRSVRNHHRVCAGAAAFHLMLQPMLGRCSALTGRPASTASMAARRSAPVTGKAFLGRLLSNWPR